MSGVNSILFQQVTQGVKAIWANQQVNIYTVQQQYRKMLEVDAALLTMAKISFHTVWEKPVVKSYILAIKLYG